MGATFRCGEYEHPTRSSPNKRAYPSRSYLNAYAVILTQRFILTQGPSSLKARTHSRPVLRDLPIRSFQEAHEPLAALLRGDFLSVAFTPPTPSGILDQRAKCAANCRDESAIHPPAPSPSAETIDARAHARRNMRKTNVPDPQTPRSSRDPFRQKPVPSKDSAHPKPTSTKNPHQPRSRATTPRATSGSDVPPTTRRVASREATS